MYVFKKYRFLLKNTGLLASKYRFVFPEVGMSDARVKWAYINKRKKNSEPCGI